MELLCPHCLKRVTVSDDKAGQVLNCPLCSGVFAAPALAPVPARSPAPPPPPPPPPPLVSKPETPVLAGNDAFTAAPPIVTPSPLEPVVQPVPRPAPPPPPPPGDYTREFAFRLRPDVLAAVPPVCLFLLFVLSFFPWHRVGDLPEGAQNVWVLAFGGEHWSALFIAYALLLFPAFLLSVASLVFEQRWVPTPPPLALLMPWKSLLTLLFVLLTFVLLCYDYQQGLLSVGAPHNPIALAEKLAWRIHGLALVALLLELWAQGQRARYRPLPRFSMKW